MKVINEFGNKEEIPFMEHKDNPNPELRLRNTANTALNYFIDHGEEAALEYILKNVPQEEEVQFRTVIEEEARKRFLWDEENTNG